MSKNLKGVSLQIETSSHPTQESSENQSMTEVPVVASIYNPSETSKSVTRQSQHRISTVFLSWKS